MSLLAYCCIFFSFRCRGKKDQTTGVGIWTRILNVRNLRRQPLRCCRPTVIAVECRYRCINYWWSVEIGNFRRMTIKSRRKVQRTWMRGTNDATRLSKEFKENKKKLARMIMNSKERCRKEFYATLDRDPWGLPYKMIIAIFREEAKMQLHIPREGLLGYVGLSRWHIH